MCSVEIQDINDNIIILILILTVIVNSSSIHNNDTTNNRTIYTDNHKAMTAES